MTKGKQSGGSPPAAYDQFVERFPGLAAAWDRIREAEKDGPLDDRTRRLVKLGVAAGREAEGATHSAARKALAAGASPEEVEQVAVLAASLLGLPATVKVHRWIREVCDRA